MAHTCRGTINLAGAFIDSEDSCSFVISNGGTQIFYMRANSEVERQRWLTALELAKAKAIKMLESGLSLCFSALVIFFPVEPALSDTSTPVQLPKSLILFIRHVYFLLKCKAPNGCDEAQLLNAVRVFIVPKFHARDSALVLID